MRDLIYGVHIIDYLINHNSKKLIKIFIKKNHQLLPKVIAAKLSYEVWTDANFKRHLEKVSHQGIAAQVKPFEYYSGKQFFENLQHNQKSQQLILILDHIESPRNFGAICRTAAATGVTAVIVTKNNQAPVNHHVIKASAGYVLGIKIILASNLVHAIKQLQANNFWVMASDMTGKNLYQISDVNDRNLAVIVGNEHAGVRKLLRTTADWTFRLPMKDVESLNVSNATAIFLYHLRNLQGFWEKG